MRLFPGHFRDPAGEERETQSIQGGSQTHTGHMPRGGRDCCCLFGSRAVLCHLQTSKCAGGKGDSQQSHILRLSLFAVVILCSERSS